MERPWCATLMASRCSRHSTGGGRTACSAHAADAKRVSSVGTFSLSSEPPPPPQPDLLRARPSLNCRRRRAARRPSATRQERRCPRSSPDGRASHRHRSRGRAEPYRPGRTHDFRRQTHDANACHTTSIWTRTGTARTCAIRRRQRIAPWVRGCEGAFSPYAEPGMANVMGRCVSELTGNIRIASR